MKKYKFWTNPSQNSYKKCMKFTNSTLPNRSKLVFPMRRDRATFRDKGTTGQAQNLAKGQDGLGQPVKILGRDEGQDCARF